MGLPSQLFGICKKGHNPLWIEYSTRKKGNFEILINPRHISFSKDKPFIILSFFFILYKSHSIGFICFYNILVAFTRFACVRSCARNLFFVIWLCLFSCLISTHTNRWVHLYLLRFSHYFCLRSQTHDIYGTATKTMKYVLFRLALSLFAFRPCFVLFSTVVAMCFCVCKVSSFTSSISTENLPEKCSFLCIFYCGRIW